MSGTNYGLWQEALVRSTCPDRPWRIILIQTRLTIRAIVDSGPKLYVISLVIVAFLGFLMILRLALVGTGGSQEEILSEEFGAAEITFISLTDMKEWIGDDSDLRWGIAITSDDLTKVLVKDGKGYNQPTVNVEDYDRYVVANNIRTGERMSLKIKPGTYDWLIIMDDDNDGSWDGYLGSIEEDIQLNELQFKAHDRYEVVVGKDSTPRLSRVINE